MSASSTEIAAFFHENGYYHAKGVFSPAEIRELEIDFDRIVQQLAKSGENINARWGGETMDKISAKDQVVVHTHNVQMYSSHWLRAFIQARFLEHTQAILGPNVILHHSKLFQKPAEKGAPFPMHQDWSYFPSVKDTMMAGIIHVSNATDEMGCLRVYPGSHKLGRVAETNGQTDAQVLRDYPLEKATVVEAEAGDVLFFHYLTLHGSMPNRSQKIRKTVLVQMHSGEDRIEDGVKHPNARLVLSGWNSEAKRSLGNES
jgi:ectoine hydroxylase-related dioxygenase (phytanoyl-CoA dioxygenase family)